MPAAPTVELERLVVRLMLDSSQYTAAMEGAVRNLESAGRNLEALGRRLTLALTVPLGALGALAVRSFASFDKAMTDSLAIMGYVSAGVRREMEEVALSLSAQGIVPVNQLAGAYRALGAAGLSASQQMAALPVVNQLATAGAMDATRAADRLMAVQRALGMNAENTAQNLGHIGDAITYATRVSGGATVTQFLDALVKAGPEMRNLNVSLEEGLAVLSLYAQQGIRGADAGLQMTRMFLTMSRASQEFFVQPPQAGFQTGGMPVGAHGRGTAHERAIRALPLRPQDWRNWGMDMYTGATGAMRPLADVFAMLEQRLSRMTDRERAFFEANIGMERQSIRTILPLLRMSEQLRGLEQRFHDVALEMQRMAELRLRTFSAQMEILRNQLVVFAIDIGRLLVPLVMEFNRGIQAAIGWWKGLDAPIRNTIVLFGALAALAGPAILLVIGMSRYLLFLFNAFWTVIKFPYTLAMGFYALYASIANLIPTSRVLLALILPLRLMWQGLDILIFQTARSLFFLSAGIMHAVGFFAILAMSIRAPFFLLQAFNHLLVFFYSQGLAGIFVRLSSLIGGGLLGIGGFLAIVSSAIGAFFTTTLLSVRILGEAGRFAGSATVIVTPLLRLYNLLVDLPVLLVRLALYIGEAGAAALKFGAAMFSHVIFSLEFAILRASAFTGSLFVMAYRGLAVAITFVVSFGAILAALAGKALVAAAIAVGSLALSIATLGVKVFLMGLGIAGLFVTVASVISSVIPVILGVTAATGPLLLLITVFGGTLSLIFSPIVGILVSITAAFGVLFNMFRAGAGDAIGTFFSNIPGFITHFQENMRVLFRWLIDNWAAVWRDIGEITQRSFLAIGRLVGAFGELIKQNVVAETAAAGRRAAAPFGAQFWTPFISGAERERQERDRLRDIQVMLEEDQNANRQAFRIAAGDAFRESFQDYAPTAPGIDFNLGNFWENIVDMLRAGPGGLWEGLGTHPYGVPGVPELGPGAGGAPADFRTVSLRRFELEGPGGLARQGTGANPMVVTFAQDDRQLFQGLVQNRRPIVGFGGGG